MSAATFGSVDQTDQESARSNPGVIAVQLPASPEKPSFTLDRKRGGQPRDIADRFFQKAVASLGCWKWTGAKTKAGYGVVWHDGKMRGAHVVAYELAHGPVPNGREIDHLCERKGCVNPGHLEAVTHRENVRRGKHRRTPVPAYGQRDSLGRFQ